MIREFNFVCIDCGQPSIAGSATAKRCAECHRIDHNKRQAAHMARKRKDPQFREADRERVRICMQRIRAGNPAKPRTLTFKQELREQRLWGQGRALFAPSAKVAKQSAMFWEERLHGIRGPT